MAVEELEKRITDTKNVVRDLLKELYPDFIEFETGTFTISKGSSQVMIVIRPYTENDTCIECMANVVSGATINPELMHFLLRKNAELHFGAFGLLFDDTVVFSHSITGSNVDANELQATIDAVTIISDHYDDEIVDMAGGQRAIDVAYSSFELS